MRSRRVWVYVLSVAALLVPAGGIAYLGAVSYRDERGAVDSEYERQRQGAREIAARIERSIEEALDEVERLVLSGVAGVPGSGVAGVPGAGVAGAVAGFPPSNRARPSAALARHWFWIDSEQKLRVPRAVPSTIVSARRSIAASAARVAGSRIASASCARGPSARRCCAVHAAPKRAATGQRPSGCTSVPPSMTRSRRRCSVSHACTPS